MRLVPASLPVVLAALLALAFAAAAQAPRENAIEATLLAETRTPAPGESVTIAIRMLPDPGWHGYWLNPGEAGLPDTWEWEVPEGVTLGELHYPVPEPLIISGIMNYAYEGEYAILAEVGIGADVAPGTRLPLRAEGNWLACTDEICVPESGAVSIELVVGQPGTTGYTTAFDAYRARLPRPLGSEARFEVAGETLRIGVPLPRAAEVSEPYFFPATDRVADYGAEQRITRNGDWLIVETVAEEGAVEAQRIEGVLKIGEDEGLSLAASPGGVPAAGSPAMQWGWAAALLALGGAIVGGLLLNVMPCVFPILSLKALSLAKAGGEPRAVRRDALAYSAGAILTCLALGATLLVLRSGGAAIGWAFQLQDPRMILFLLLLVTAIALNLAGLFEVPSLVGRGAATAEGRGGSFLTGALAAFVATPCTGPFMAAALGAALVLPGALALAVFAGLGLGLALPFLAIAFVPALRRRIPAPGPWMARLRHILSVPMFLTALALAWVLGRQTGADGMTLGLAAALLVGLGLWWTGSRQGRGLGAWLPVLLALAVSAAAILFVPPPGAAAEAESGALDAEPFSETRLAQLREAGTPVFVYFTADWCITCKANEAGALSRAAVAEHFEEQGIRVLVGDWTTGDPEIGRFLESHGRSGIPLYLYYPPGGNPEVLPQLLTVSRLTALSGRLS